ncbi:hypothetical protein Ddye_021275 [Dipteronia dyeriana]|uniref:Pentatricopeptide repeat-containing protein n=1 Tax=Dipteronia dyeriana TaxID=168575 RepID=A0AAD9WXU1_9ROSI|nr:hypothetical protein Ddye_021275 [Dipteronia dyeriana]
MDDKSVVSWTTMIGAYVQWNQSDEAILVFERMESKNMKPNEENTLMVFEELPEKDVMTWTALIVGLAMCGEGNKALDYFHEKQIRGLNSTHRTSGCLVEVLGGAGRIAEAEELIRNMLMAPDHFVLGGLLVACRIHGNLKAAERAVKQLLERYPENDGMYFIL